MPVPDFPAASVYVHGMLFLDVVQKVFEPPSAHLVAPHEAAVKRAVFHKLRPFLPR